MTAPRSIGQLIGSKVTRPVESVSAMQGAEADDAPTCTAAPVRGALVSASIT